MKGSNIDSIQCYEEVKMCTKSAKMENKQITDEKVQKFKYVNL